MPDIFIPENTSDPSAPSSGNRIIYPKSDGWYDMGADGVPHKLAAAGSGAPATPQYVVASPATGDLPNSLVLAAGNNITITNTSGSLVVASTATGGSSSGLQSISGSSPITVISGSVAAHNGSGITPGTYNLAAFNITGHVTSGSLVPYLTSVSGSSPITVLSGSVVALEDSGIVPGAYNFVQFNSKGLAISGSYVPGGGGSGSSGVDGSGTPGKIVKWYGTTTLTDSIISDDGSIVTIGSGLNAIPDETINLDTGFRILTSGSSALKKGMELINYGNRPNLKLVHVPMTSGSISNTKNANSLGFISFEGCISGSSAYGAFIAAEAEEDWVTTNGTRLLLYWTSSGSASSTRGLWLTNNVIRPITGGAALTLGESLFKFDNVFSNKLTLTSGSPAPASPASGDVVIFDLNDRLYKKNSSGEVQAITQSIGQMFVSGAEMWPTSGSTGATSGSGWQTPTNKQTFYSMDFSPSANKSAEVSFILPLDYKTGAALSCYPIWTGISGSMSGSTAWKLEATSYSNWGVSLDAAWGTSGSVVIASSGSAYITETNASSPVNITPSGSPSAGGQCEIRITRLTDNAGDTFPEIARLLGIRITYSTLATIT